MKKAIILLLSITLIPVLVHGQSIKNLDYISPFHDGIAAIKQGNEWAFINQKGEIIVNFRNDLVATTTSEGNFPIFDNERCLIVNIKDGISYFGYIDTTGKTVIETQFLNATNFNNGMAIALKLDKEVTAKNTALNKDVVYYKYFQVTIDSNGDIKNYLSEKGVNIVLDKKFLSTPPIITSKRISDQLFSIKGEDGKLAVKKIN